MDHTRLLSPVQFVSKYIPTVISQIPWGVAAGFCSSEKPVSASLAESKLDVAFQVMVLYYGPANLLGKYKRKKEIRKEGRKTEPGKQNPYYYAESHSSKLNQGESRTWCVCYHIYINLSYLHLLTSHFIHRDLALSVRSGMRDAFKLSGGNPIKLQAHFCFLHPPRTLIITEQFVPAQKELWGNGGPSTMGQCPWLQGE